jgi:pimeloyl-ACP methyl ester carboxylesterase
VEGLLFPESLARSKPQLRQYDLLGFDPRGFGASTRVRCWVDQKKLDKLPKVADRRVRNRATHRVEVAEAKLFGEACSANPRSGDVSARYINTQQTVWDLDFLRRLMERNKARSYPKLNYIGYSYGTWLGAWYADTFPANVGKFILDSNMQWTTSMYANQTLDSKSFQRRRDKMFFPYVARHHRDFGLGKTTSKVKKKYESIRKGLAKQAAKDLKKGKAVAFGPEDLDYVVSSLLYSNELFPAAGYITELAGDFAKKPSSSKYRKALAKRVKAPMTKAPFVVQRSSKKVAGSALTDISDGLAGTIVRCNDSRTPGNIKSLLKRADSDAKKYRFTGYLNTVPLCAYWKFKPQTRTIDLAGLSSSNKMLMFQSEGDPATAYEGALAAHRRTASRTVLVSVDNEGQHGLYIDGPSRCVDTIGDRFLFTTWKPTADTRCTTSPLPYDKKVYTLSGPVSGAKSTASKAVKPKNGAVKAVRADVAKRGIS